MSADPPPAGPGDLSGPLPPVRLERLLPASPVEVYAAWTQPALLAQWMSPRGHAEAEVDLRVGGRLRIVMADGGVRIEHHGEFLELTPPNRLRFSWISPYTGNDPSEVTVELTADGAGTRLVLTHQRLPGREVAAHASGWTAMLERLMELLGAATVEEVEP